MTQAGLLEHLKLENVSLSHQLTETQHRSFKEKERIALQLQGIEVRPAFCGSVRQLCVLVFGLGYLYWTLLEVKEKKSVEIRVRKR